MSGAISFWRFGGRNVIDPDERHAIEPDIAALTPDLGYPGAIVTVLSPARNFWEKATLIHVACHRRQLANNPGRLSRRRFDLTCLATHDGGRAALADRALLADVVRHRKVFFHAGNADYDQCLDGQPRLVPDEDQLPVLPSDRDAMRNARIIGDDAPGFAVLIERFRILEAEANPPDRNRYIRVSRASASLHRRPVAIFDRRCALQPARRRRSRGTDRPSPCDQSPEPEHQL